MELNSTNLHSVLIQFGYDIDFLRQLTTIVLFMYNHMIYFIGIPQLIFNLCVSGIVIYWSLVMPGST
jgi:hypothetical protein